MLSIGMFSLQLSGVEFVAVSDGRCLYVRSYLGKLEIRLAKS